MLLLAMWNYIRGYVIILIEGQFPERFLNICVRRQILLWGIEMTEEGSLILRTSIKGFRNMRVACTRSGCRASLIAKKGLPFLQRRIKKRRTFAAGAIISLIVVVLLASFVWGIDITGNERIETDWLLSVLADNGIKPGTLKYGIDTDEAVNRLMREIPDLAWAGISIRGTRVHVEIAETKKKPVIIALDTPCNIIAKHDGVIEKLVVKAGQEKVRKGETVIKGQLLVSGMVETKVADGTTIPVHAIAEVMARTWYEGRREIVLTKDERTRTGREMWNFYIIIFGGRFGFFTKEPVFEVFDKVVEKDNLKIGEKFILPLSIEVEKFYEVEYNVIKMESSEAREYAIKTIYDEILSKLGGKRKVTSVRRSITPTEDGREEASVIFECIEDIALEATIN